MPRGLTGIVVSESQIREVVFGSREMQQTKKPRTHEQKPRILAQLGLGLFDTVYCQ